LQEVRGMSLASVGRLLWLMFVAADAGSFVGGIAAARRIRRGASPVSSRMRIMVFAAVVPCFTFVIPRMPGYVLPLVGGCCAAFAHMAWMTNATTLPIDIFPAGMIGSVQGAIGALSSVAAFISTGLIAFAVTHLSYRPVFYVASILYPLSLIALAQIPRVGPKGANVSL
jgi:ACS family hexuronate transporter-like MFS transporter